MDLTRDHHHQSQHGTTGGRRRSPDSSGSHTASETHTTPRLITKSPHTDRVVKKGRTGGSPTTRHSHTPTTYRHATPIPTPTHTNVPPFAAPTLPNAVRPVLNGDVDRVSLETALRGALLGVSDLTTLLARASPENRPSVLTHLRGLRERIVGALAPYEPAQPTPTPTSGNHHDTSPRYADIVKATTTPSPPKANKTNTTQPKPTTPNKNAGANRRQTRPTFRRVVVEVPLQPTRQLWTTCVRRTLRFSGTTSTRTRRKWTLTSRLRPFASPSNNNVVISPADESSASSLSSSRGTLATSKGQTE